METREKTTPFSVDLATLQLYLFWSVPEWLLCLSVFFAPHNPLIEWKIYHLFILKTDLRAIMDGKQMLRVPGQLFYFTRS